MGETSYGVTQTVNTLRFNSLSRWPTTFPPNAAARLGARALSLALEGTNLGLHTNYKGKDPNVNAIRDRQQHARHWRAAAAAHVVIGAPCQLTEADLSCR